MNHSRNPSIDLGLAVMSAVRKPGCTFTHAAIAEVCEFTTGGVWMIESRALHKLKRAIFMRNDPVLLELLESL